MTFGHCIKTSHPEANNMKYIPYITALALCSCTYAPKSYRNNSQTTTNNYMTERGTGYKYTGGSKEDDIDALIRAGIQHDLEVIRGIR